MIDGRGELLLVHNCFAYQFNPTRRGLDAVAPFIPHPFQIDLLLARPETHRHLAPNDRGVLWCYENDKSMAVEKSRFQGASWLFLFFQNWLCGFHDYIQTLNISHKEDAVDDGTRDSLFWKLRYMQEKQPQWLMGEITTNRLYFYYHRTHSEIRGEATTRKTSVGGRASVIFADEFGENQLATEVRQKTALTANCRFFNGTHTGVGTEFQKMCDPAQSPEIVRYRLHWTANPTQCAGLYRYNPGRPSVPEVIDKGYPFPADYPFVLDGRPTGGPMPGVRSPWYDAKCLEIGEDRAAAIQLDISPEGAARQFFDQLKVRAIVVGSARDPVWRGEPMYDTKGNLCGLAEDPKGRLKLWARPKGDGKLPAARYTAGADIAAGTGATPSCLAGFNGDRSERVLEYANPFVVEPEFAKIVVALCQLMADPSGQGAYLTWDSSGQQGTKFEQEVLRLGYRHVHWDDDDVLDRGLKKVKRPGWFGHGDRKRHLLLDYQQAIYSGRLAERSEDCLLETLMFEYDKAGKIRHGGEFRTNDPSGAGVNHGDRVIAAALGWMLAKEMAEGGSRDLAKTYGPAPGTLEWLMAIHEGRKRQLEEVW